MRNLIALLVLLSPVGLQAETLVRHCATLVSGSCQSSIYVRPADATVVRVLRTNVPYVPLSSVLETEKISVCVDDPTLSVGGAGPCTTRVPGRTDNWLPKSTVYAEPAPPTSTWTGSTKLSWTPPTKNSDGSTLTNLAGYLIEYGDSPDGLINDVSVPITTSYTLSGLPQGRYFAGVRAVNSAGIYSELSNIVEFQLTESVPTCAAKPADETRTNQCDVPAVGSWTQTRTYAEAAYPVCWAPGEWLPSSAPAEACVVPEVWKVAPTRSNVRPVYEAILNADGNAIVRGNREGSIASGQPCGEEKFKVSRNSYRAVTESDVSLDSPTYKGREHVAICVR